MNIERNNPEYEQIPESGTEHAKLEWEQKRLEEIANDLESESNNDPFVALKKLVERAIAKLR